MLHREADGGYLVITQPAHAWLSAQIASAWGNERTGQIEPRAELVLAAQEHDIGWLAWESSPTLNRQTGRPHTFMELSTTDHLGVWAPAGPRALVYGPYVAMLVSMHGTGLYERHDYTRDTDAEAEAARRFAREGAAFEERMRRQVRNDPQRQQFASDESISRNRRLVAVWDAMSLFLCSGLRGERQIGDVPMQDRASFITMSPGDSIDDPVQIAPWPFAGKRLEVIVPGRKVNETFSDETVMRKALEVAEWVTLGMVLEPAR